MHIYIYIHTYIHTHTHIYIYMCVCVCVPRHTLRIFKDSSMSIHIHCYWKYWNLNYQCWDLHLSQPGSLSCGGNEGCFIRWSCSRREWINYGVRSPVLEWCFAGLETMIFKMQRKLHQQQIPVLQGGRAGWDNHILSYIFKSKQGSLDSARSV